MYLKKHLSEPAFADAKCQFRRRVKLEVKKIFASNYRIFLDHVFKLVVSGTTQKMGRSQNLIQVSFLLPAYGIITHEWNSLRLSFSIDVKLNLHIVLNIAGFN